MRALFRRWGIWLIGSGVALMLGVPQLRAQNRHPSSQGQAASQFLHDVLLADYELAYGCLAPEVRQAFSFGRFVAVARPLWKSGQRRGDAIALYKLGVRLGSQGASQLFYSFSFVADSSSKPPPVLLEVVFRDTAARAVLGFSLRPAAAQRPKPTPTKP